MSTGAHEEHHHHHHYDGSDDHGEGGFRGAFFLNLAFTVVEIVGGLLTNSIAILSDAVHDLGDSISLLFAWSMERISRKKRTQRLTFGYKRYSVLGAVVSGGVLLVGSVFILMEAVPRLFQPEAVSAEGMLPLAVAGIAFNGAAALRLRGGEKLNQRLVLLHLLEDVLGWVGVLVVSIVLLFADLPILDPLLSLAITVFVLSRIFPRLRHALGVFLQHAPKGMDLEGIRERAVSTVPHVVDLHDMHLWSLDGSYHLFSCHVVVDTDLSLHELDEVKEHVKNVLAQKGIQHATLEFEPGTSGCVACDL